VTAIAQSLPSSAPIGRERRLSLETTGDADVLLRVLVVLRRRGFVVRACDFRAGDRHAPTQLDLCVESPARTGGQVRAWLMNVVGVVGVAEQ
jgi:acetolactate synthase regulatory subunit